MAFILCLEELLLNVISVPHSPNSSCATFLSIPQFAFTYDPLLNRRMTTWNHIPVNFFSVKCVRIFVSGHRIWISKDLPKASEDCRRFRKTSEDHRWFPTTSEDFPTTSDDNRICRKIFDDFKKSRQRFPKDFQPISSIIKEFWRCSDDFSNIKKQLNFYLIGF